MRVFSASIPRDDVPVTVTFEGRQIDATQARAAQAFDPAAIIRPSVPALPATSDSTGLVEVPLIELAWGRSGDKGDAFNLGIIARRPEYLDWIRGALDPDALLHWFAHEFEGASHPAVHRYEVPGLSAINLHFLNSLGGGQFASLRLDPLAKGKAQQLLDMPVRVPVGLVSA